MVIMKKLQSIAPRSTRALRTPMNGLRVALFGTFYPETTMAGNSSTGFATALVESEALASVIIFAQLGASLPEGEGWSKARLIPCWNHNDPISLIRAIPILVAESRNVDGFLFNTYVTGFGRTAPANVVGLLIPPLLALLTRKPVTVYMHNFLETQDAVQLGYRPSLAQRLGVRLLEKLMLYLTQVVVPLESQAATISRIFHIVPKRIFIPFSEPFGLVASTEPSHIKKRGFSNAPAKILLLGNWGPQKDLTGVLKALLTAREQGGSFTVSLTGIINPHFPHYQNEMETLLSTLDVNLFHFLGTVPENEMINVLNCHDLVILPYNATGGYSGAMSLSAYCGIGIISYDLPQLRETAKELGVEPVFVPKGDTDALAKEILTFCSKVNTFRKNRISLPNPEYDAKVREGVNRLVETLTSSSSTVITRRV
jgi:glycosyltransferase involved in cell wall biosynthesis